MSAEGPAERLSRLAGPDGVVVGLAIDHRDTLRAAWRRVVGEPADDEALRALKERLVARLAPSTSTVLLDAELGGPALRRLPGQVALVMPLEAQGHAGGDDDRRTVVLDDFGPAQAARVGASACKLLLPFRVDRPAADDQERLLDEVLRRCHEAGLPLVVEPIVYRLGGEDSDDFGAAFRDLVVEGARRLAGHRPDMLKLQFPAVDVPPARHVAACAALNEACRPVPWVLLGGGADPALVAAQLAVARAAGAVGFMAGRTVWGPALVADPSAQQELIDGPCRAALATLTEVARREVGRPPS